jgi:hypothetical protein
LEGIASTPIVESPASVREVAMPTHVQPVEGRWYYDANGGRKLQVTRVDEDDMLVEARFEDGHTERYPQAAWRELQLEPQAEDRHPGSASSGLSDEDYRRATGWAEKSPDDFPDS